MNALRRAAVIGHPVAHSRSPALFARFAAASGIALAYEALDVAPGELAATLARWRTQPDFVGCNVTLPHKERALALADRTEAAARACGAANVLTRVGDVLVADNTDVAGVEAALAANGVALRGALAGALLAVSSAFATYAAVQTGMPIVGALIFPVGLAMIVLLGLELVTGAFGILPIGMHARRVSAGPMLANWGYVFVGNLLGSVLFGVLLALALTMSFHAEDKTGLAQKIVLVATAKTAGYEHAGSAGMLTVFVKAILCNWLVCLGVILGASSRSTFGKIAACWLPIVIFYALGFEHAVVNMYAIPTGMMLGAKVSMAQWWMWNQIPVTLGNLVGGYLFTGAALYLTHAQRTPAATAAAAVPEPSLVPIPSVN